MSRILSLWAGCICICLIVLLTAWLMLALGDGFRAYGLCLITGSQCDERKPVPRAVPSFNTTLTQLVVEYQAQPYRLNFTVVVSITTFMRRADNARRALQSLAEQSYAPDIIKVSVPATVKSHRGTKADALAEEDALAKMLTLRMPKRTQLQVRKIDRDYGPATKLLAALEDRSLPADAVIITVDDDVLCTHNFVLTLAMASQVADTIPRPAGVIGYAPGFAAEGVWRDDLGRFDSQLVDMCWNDEGGVLDRSFVFGVAGSSYRVGWFADGEIFALQKSVPASCWLHDDVYIGGNLFRLGVKIYVLCGHGEGTYGHGSSGNLGASHAHYTNWSLREECQRFFGFGTEAGNLQSLGEHLPYLGAPFYTQQHVRRFRSTFWNRLLPAFASLSVLSALIFGAFGGIGRCRVSRRAADLKTELLKSV